ncbi:hypothetical protein Esti_000576 [Eimeria stiedai]
MQRANYRLPLRDPHMRAESGRCPHNVNFKPAAAPAAAPAATSGPAKPAATAAAPAAQAAAPAASEEEQTKAFSCLILVSRLSVQGLSLLGLKTSVTSRLHPSRFCAFTEAMNKQTMQMWTGTPVFPLPFLEFEKRGERLLLRRLLLLLLPLGLRALLHARRPRAGMVLGTCILHLSEMESQGPPSRRPGRRTEGRSLKASSSLLLKPVRGALKDSSSSSNTSSSNDSSSGSSCGNDICRLTCPWGCSPRARRPTVVGKAAGLL